MLSTPWMWMWLFGASGSDLWSVVVLYGFMISCDIRKDSLPSLSSFSNFNIVPNIWHRWKRWKINLHLPAEYIPRIDRFFQSKNTHITERINGIGSKQQNPIGIALHINWQSNFQELGFYLLPDASLIWSANGIAYQLAIYLNFLPFFFSIQNKHSVTFIDFRIHT